MSNRTCSVPDCPTDMTGKYLRKSYCEKHYYSWRKYGTPTPTSHQRRAARKGYSPEPGNCVQCSTEFLRANHNSKYCSDICRSWAAFLGPGKSKHCSDCGDPMIMSRTSKPGPGRCAGCSKHGFGGYARGCRCDVCAGAKASHMRDYVEQRIARDGVHPTTALRRVARGRGPLETAYDRKPVPCRECGEAVMSELSEGEAVHSACRTDSAFYVPKSVRLGVYERDGWKCQICFHPVDRDATVLSDWYPTLDHIIPQSVRVDHSAENLRLACRYCNLARRDRPAEKDHIVRKWANERRSLEVA